MKQKIDGGHKMRELRRDYKNEVLDEWGRVKPSQRRYRCECGAAYEQHKCIGDYRWGKCGRKIIWVCPDKGKAYEIG